MVSWRHLVAEAVAVLAEAGVPDPESSARWIGRQATGTDATDWLDVAEADATQRQLVHFDAMVRRRAAGEPLQYVVGSWGFRSLDLFVDRRVLIPRPETEVVAGRALDEARRLATGADEPVVVVDLGTGSGAIGLAIAAEQPGLEVWLTDVSADALAVARANIAGLGTAGGAVRAAEGDWFDALPAGLRGRVGVAVANPPYVADPDELEPEVAAWEPSSALLAGNGGTAHLRRLVVEAPGWLHAGGALVLEMDPEQVQVMTVLAAERFAEVEAFEDLTRRPRGLVARRPT